MSGMTVRYLITGLNEIRQKLADPQNQLLARPWAEAMEQIGVIGQREATAGAPSKSGQTVAKMFHRTQSKPMPMWVAIGTKAVAQAPMSSRRFAKEFSQSKRLPTKITRKREGKRGSWSYPYSYPARLNYDPKSRYFGWFTRAIERTIMAADGILDQAAKKIQDNWEK